jgi:hypothetical protein
MTEYLKAKLAVMRDVKYLRKDKRMQAGGSYTYIGESAIVRRLRRAMIENGIAVAPINMELVSRESFQTAKGGTSHSTILKVTWRFSHESGQSEDVTTIGEAADHGDKASNKSMTAAKKYALLLWGLIETGDDPDDTSSEQFRRAQAPAAMQPDPRHPANAPLTRKEVADHVNGESPLYADFAKFLNEQVETGVYPDKEAAKKAAMTYAHELNHTGKSLQQCRIQKVFDTIKERMSGGAKKTGGNFLGVKQPTANF